MGPAIVRSGTLTRLKPLAASLAIVLTLNASFTFARPAAIASWPPNAQDLATLPALLRAGVVRPPPWQTTPQHRSMVNWRRLPQHEIPPLPEASVPVTNCNDSGAGSLRDALQSVAVDGDTVDLTGLSCSTITLTSGPILFGQDSVTLQGPGPYSLYLSGGSGANKVAPLLHAGTGTLTINDLSIENGAKYFTSSATADARGGCIFSTGFVALNHSEVIYCKAKTTSATYNALGGAIYAAGGVSLSDTYIALGFAYASNTYGGGGAIYTPGSVDIEDSYIKASGASSAGGGIIASQGVRIRYSTIAGNSANLIGGVYSRSGNVSIENSTIAANTAVADGGLWLSARGATAPVTIVNSTVSGNNATGGAVGGIFLYAGGHYPALIANSTIAFNTTHYSGSVKYGAGVRAESSTIDLESTIIAGNTNDDGNGTVDDDIDGTMATLVGANNLIGAASITTPADTISADPELQPLAYNGGETLTHALDVTSPAINVGNNIEGASNDQRGVGFPRVIGTQADIGAFEFDTSDVLFRDGFD
jgi:hypothetical protein